MKLATSSSMTTAQFEHDCRAAVDRLRTALIELYSSLGADPESPQEVARRFQVNKTLTWNISRVLSAANSLAAVPHVPGSSALKILLRATRRAGASTAVVEPVLDATRAFESMIKTHAGDRATLDLMLDGMVPGNSDALELSRKLAFRGNSGICGVQARTRVRCCFLAPNASDPSKLDLASVTGFVGFRRLRPGVRWPLAKVRGWSSANEPVADQQWAPIDPSSNGEGDPALLRQFSSPRLQPVETVKSPEGLDVVLTAGTVGNAGAFDYFRGEMMPAAARRYAGAGDETGEFGTTIAAPCEQLLFDLIVHRDLEFALNPELLVFGRIFAHGQQTGTRDDESLLPIAQLLVPLLGSPPVVATPHVPKYSELVQTVLTRLSVNPQEMRGVRLMMKYPPLGANVILRFPLPPPPV